MLTLPTHAEDLDPRPPRPFGVLRSGGEFRLVATDAARAGAVILHVEGVVVAVPSRHSIQVGVDAHLEAVPDSSVTDSLDDTAWRFLNHSCRPNTWLRGRELVALRDIVAWEELTFDYHTTEWRMASPFSCRCGAPHCVGEIRGYAHLSAPDRDRLQPFVAPHLLRLSRD